MAMKIVENKDRKFGSAKEYIHVVIDGWDALFTSDEISRAFERASRNLEDLPPPPLLTRLRRWLRRTK